MNWKRFDVFAIIVLPLIAAAIVLKLNTDLIFISSLLFFGLPSLYIGLRNPGILRKSATFAFIFSIPMSIIIDTLSALNGAYVIPKTIFPFKIFGISTVELYLFSFLWVLMSVLFYEYFFDHGRKGDAISKRIRIFLYIVFAFSVVVLIMLFANSRWLLIPYAYLVLGTLFTIIPLVAFLYFHPQFLPRFVVIAAYYFSFLMLYELVALATHEWIFPGQFIGFVTVQGLSFPLEELLIWMIVCTPALLSYYEFVADDSKL